MVPYISIIHDLVDSLPTVKQRWKEQRQLLFQLTQTGETTVAETPAVSRGTARTRPDSNPSVASSTALEIATQEIGRN